MTRDEIAAALALCDRAATLQDPSLISGRVLKKALAALQRVWNVVENGGDAMDDVRAALLGDDADGR